MHWNRQAIGSCVLLDKPNLVWVCIPCLAKCYDTLRHRSLEFALASKYTGICITLCLVLQG